MGSRPWNLALRFGLELAALAGLALLGWNLATGWWRWPVAIVMPVAAALAWAVFAVPEDPSRSGKAPVPVRGMARLALEFAVFFMGAAGFISAGHQVTGSAVVALVVLHYVLSYDRIAWLLRR